MIKYLADLVYVDGEGDVQLPYERVTYEEKNVLNCDELIMTYVFDDASSVKIKYTKDGDYILKAAKGTVEGKLKKTY